MAAGRDARPLPTVHLEVRVNNQIVLLEDVADYQFSNNGGKLSIAGKTRDIRDQVAIPHEYNPVAYDPWPDEPPKKKAPAKRPPKKATAKEPVGTRMVDSTDPRESEQSLDQFHDGSRH